MTLVRPQHTKLLLGGSDIRGGRRPTTVREGLKDEEVPVQRDASKDKL